MQTIVTSVLSTCWSVCVCSLLSILMNPVKTLDAVWMWTRVGPRNHVYRGLLSLPEKEALLGRHTSICLQMPVVNILSIIHKHMWCCLATSNCSNLFHYVPFQKIDAVWLFCLYLLMFCITVPGYGSWWLLCVCPVLDKSYRDDFRSQTCCKVREKVEDTAWWISGALSECISLADSSWCCSLACMMSMRCIALWNNSYIISGYLLLSLLKVSVVFNQLSGARCRLVYGPADATATHCLLLQ